jgi:uncharacterized phage infection (PIP) family protein YhgE
MILTSSEITQNLYQQLEEVRQRYTAVENKFKAAVRTQKPSKRHRQRAKVSLKNVRSGIESTERQLKQIDDSRYMKSSTIRRRMNEIAQAIASYAQDLEEVEDNPPVAEEDDEKKPTEQKPEPRPIPPSTQTMP